jgi:hypothetical protein
MSATTFGVALAQAGLEVRVDELGKVAVIARDSPDALVLDAVRRREIVALGRAHGFTNVCIEIAGTDAAVPRA